MSSVRRKIDPALDIYSGQLRWLLSVKHAIVLTEREKELLALPRYIRVSAEISKRYETPRVAECHRFVFLKFSEHPGIAATPPRVFIAS